MNGKGSKMFKALMIGAVALGAMAGAGAAEARDGARGEKMFQKADLNGDGRIDQGEAEQMRDARFARMDVNGDGVVSQDEMAEVSKKRRAERMAKRFERLDLNGDGVIQRVEFEDGGVRRFEMMDANGDGAVTLEEIREKLRRRGG